VDSFGNPKARDVVWGQGKVDIKGVLSQLEAEKFGGVILIDIEQDGGDVDSKIKGCIEYFKKTAGQKAPADAKEKSAG